MNSAVAERVLHPHEPILWPKVSWGQETTKMDRVLPHQNMLLGILILNWLLKKKDSGIASDSLPLLA